MTLSSEIDDSTTPDSDSLDSVEPASDRVPLGTLLSWGPPIYGASSALFFVQFFFLKFATDVLLIAPVVVGVIFAAGRLWDAVSDPLVGTLSDRTRSSLLRAPL